MTEANKANWNSEGENADRMTADFCTDCVCDDRAGDAAEEILDTEGRDDFVPTILKGVFARRAVDVKGREGIYLKS
jgi:hypothetical protein